MSSSPPSSRQYRADLGLPRASPERMKRLLSPKSIAIVGATDRSRWAALLVANLDQLHYGGAVHLVNRRSTTAFGRPTVPSCVEIGEPVDVAILLVPSHAVPEALRDAAAAGAQAAVVLASGYAEAGPSGVALQDELVALARDLDIGLIGPNCLGYANLLDGASAWTSLVHRDHRLGGIAVVSQSGNMAGTISGLATMQGLRLSHIVSTGNEATIDTADFVRSIVEDERVRVVAMFVEGIRDPEFFLEAAARAAELAKPIVMLKVGTSELGRALTQTHTGALAGNDRIIDAALRAAGVVRVSSLEELVVTAGLLAHTGPLPPGGLGVVSISGGANDLIADRADALGLAIPTLAAETVAHIEEHKVGYATAQNPFDVTGGALGQDELWVEPTRAIAADPSVAIVAIAGLPTLDPAVGNPAAFAAITEGIGSGPAQRRGVMMLNTLQTISPELRRTLDEAGVEHIMGGIDDAVSAIGNAMTWSAWLRDHESEKARPVGNGAANRRTIDDADPRGAWSEDTTLELLSAHGIPVVPRRVVTDAKAAVEAAQQFGYPVVVKLVSPEILHKSDIGGVVLGVDSDAAVIEAYERVMGAFASVDGARLDGVLIAPMRTGGVELILGVNREPDWGLAIAVGLGGIFVEVLGESVLRPLPVSPEEAEAMLQGLRGSRLLEGFRGAPAADLAQLSRVVADFGDLALALGPDLQSLEVNPLRVDGATIEALDAAISWRESESEP